MPLDDFGTRRAPAILVRDRRTGVTVAQLADDGPTVERARKAPIDRGWSDGREEGRAFRVRDSILFMRQNRTITEGEFIAAMAFRQCFERASTHGFAARDLATVGTGGGGDPAGVPDTVLSAHRRVRRALAALGGPASIASRVVVKMAGEGKSANAVGKELMTEGREIRTELLLGVLVGALAVLAGAVEQRRA